MMKHRTFFSLALLGVLFSALPASADPSEEAKHLSKSRRAERYEVATPYSSTKAGAARVSVRAPMDVVRDVVTDYGAYDDHIKKFNKAQVVGRHGDKTDVYLQVPILKGVAKVWAVVRFEPVKKQGDGDELIVGHMVTGNVKKLDAWVRLKKIDEQNTQLNIELLIVPDLPVPGSLVTPEVAYAADQAVTGLRNHSEKINAKK